MEFISKYTDYVEKELQKIDFPESPLGLYESLSYFLQIGGKRMRPILTLLGTELFGVPKEKAIHAALAVELFHNFTLIHDDIMDEAPLRRGFETVHQKWDSNTAILSGDTLMIKAYQLLEQQQGDLPTMFFAFNKTAIEVCEGQQLDVDFAERTDVEIDDYIEMIRLKTSVLLGGALELAAIVAETTTENRTRLYNFGVNVGLAFQIQDDILDLYADPSKFGKQIGGDVVANKKTILYLLAKKYADTNQLERLEQFSKETDKTKKIAETKRLFDEIGVKDKSLEMVNHYFHLAKQQMEEIDVPAENKIPLTNLSNYLLKREV